MCSLSSSAPQDAATPQDLRLCDVLEEVGRVPLPPYMKREADTRDLESYQTPHALHQAHILKSSKVVSAPACYSQIPASTNFAEFQHFAPHPHALHPTPCLHQGSVAAPTAGLHFSREVVAAMRARGVVECHLTLHVGTNSQKPSSHAVLQYIYQGTDVFRMCVHLTLHVGAGTFRPMDVTSAADHDMHSEWLCVSHDSLCLLREAVATRRPVVPVGVRIARMRIYMYA